jgi:Tfp pilus assembly protein PilF
MCVDTGRLRDAKLLLRDALQRDNSVEHAVYLYCEQGYVLRTEGLYEAARRSYEMALALDRDCVAARDGLELVRTECPE